MSRIAIIAILVFVTCILSAGCSSGQPAPAPVTPAVTATPEPTPPPVVVTTATTSPDEGGTESLPPAQAVEVLLTKDRPTSQISLLYQGGAGDKVTTKIVMHVYDASGSYTEYVMSDGRKPVPGNEILAKGTRGTEGDRCVVYIYSAGKPYRVIDRVVYTMQ